MRGGSYGKFVLTFPFHILGHALRDYIGRKMRQRKGGVLMRSSCRSSHSPPVGSGSSCELASSFRL